MLTCTLRRGDSSLTALQVLKHTPTQLPAAVRLRLTALYVLPVSLQGQRSAAQCFFFFLIPSGIHKVSLEVPVSKARPCSSKQIQGI